MGHPHQNLHNVLVFHAFINSHIMAEVCQLAHIHRENRSSHSLDSSA
jgi:hypothetical protein